MYKLVLASIWLCYFTWYLTCIIDPRFYDISDKTLDRQQIPKDSKLRLIYINKNASPQLKCIAIEAIVFFILNIIYTIVAFILFAILKDDQIVERISFWYFFLFMIVTGVTFFVVNFKK